MEANDDFTKSILGGTLKTPAQADSESLQAKWVNNLSELSLRAQDVVDIIEKAKTYHKMYKKEPCHDNIKPILHPHEKLYLRLVICIKQKSSNKVHVLLSEKTQVHFPVCEIYPARSLHATLRKFMIVSMDSFNFWLLSILLLIFFNLIHFKLFFAGNIWCRPTIGLT